MKNSENYNFKPVLSFKKKTGLLNFKKKQLYNDLKNGIMKLQLSVFFATYDIYYI